MSLRDAYSIKQNPLKNPTCQANQVKMILCQKDLHVLVVALKLLFCFFFFQKTRS